MEVRLATACVRGAGSAMEARLVLPGHLQQCACSYGCVKLRPGCGAEVARACEATTSGHDDDDKLRWWGSCRRVCTAPARSARAWWRRRVRQWGGSRWHSAWGASETTLWFGCLW
nr:unnamed protein product [Digitaria exilis]CAB3505127.1 unnamed protein product [Digitaria exilis]